MQLSNEAIQKYVESGIAFVQRAGITALELKPRYVKLKAPLEGNVNHIGSMYAGALFTLAEMPGGALFLTTFDVSKFYPIIKEMNIRFKALAKTDVTIELSFTEDEVERIESEALENGKADYILEGEIKDETGQVVAVSRGIYQLRAHGT